MEWMLAAARRRRSLAGQAAVVRKLDVLDVGAGSGRDVTYLARVSDVRVFGIDKSEAFMRHLKMREAKGDIPSGSCIKADMCDLSVFSDNSFDVVRHNATLLHLPIIGPGYTLDRALSECYRVLRDNGVLFVSVKQGTSVEFVDTEEGLGGRVYQFFTEPVLTTILKRNRFKIVETQNAPSSRNPQVIWLRVLAFKCV
jgi:ubiquinone/menaquinone biosynthesis C-methylase UbiE